MNAYKLADEAKNIHNTIEALEFVQKAVPMLRQQADRIVLLEAYLKSEELRIAELEKDLKKYDQLAWDDLNKSKTIWCACGDGITADSGAKCGICASTTQQTNDGCGNCHACLVGVMENNMPVTSQRMIVCSDCGNKRCPKASNHRHKCTGSNEVGQYGSIYTAPRELSDEEILNIAFCSEIDTVAIENDWNGTVLQFAREILKKASEK